jgi:predicted PurR-regulated permease PerM
MLADRSADNARLYALAAFALAALAMGFLSFRILKPFLASIAWAIILAVACRRPWLALEARFPRHRSLAAGLMVLAVVLVVLVPFGAFAAAVAAQAAEAGSAIAAALEQENIRSFGDFIKAPAIAEMLEAVQKRVGVRPEDFQKVAGAIVGKASAMAAKLGGVLIVSAFDGVLTFLNAIFILFFLFRDGRELANGALGLLPMGTEAREGLAESLRAMVEGIFRGSLLCGLVQGATGAIGWWIAGLPSPALAGTAMGILSLLPIGGTALVWLPGSAWAWVDGRHGAAVFLLIWGAVVVSFVADNLLRPILLSGAQQMSTLTVFLGVFGGIAAFGLLGIFIGPIVLALTVWLVAVMRKLAMPPPVVNAAATPSAVPPG